MDRLHYNFGEMLALAGELRGDAARLRASNDDLQGYVRGLVATWESSAQQAYAVEQANWDRAQSDLLTTLNAVANAVEQGANDMAATEARNAAQWAD